MASKAPINKQIDNKDIGWVRWFSDISDILTSPNWDDGPRTFPNPAAVEKELKFVGVTGSFSATLTFVRHGKILFFDVLIVPSGVIISTLGTSYFELPSLKVNGGSSVAIKAQGFGQLNAFDVTTPQDLGQGYVKVNTLQAYMPTFTISNNVSITGSVRIEGL